MTQPAANNTPKLPEVLKIGDQEFKVSEHPELQSFLSEVQAAASTIEKRKLYTQIDELKKTMEALNKVQVVAPDNTEGLARFKSELLAEVTNIVKENLTPITKRNEQVAQMEVADYRNKLLAENQGTIVPELLVGTTREELDAALPAAKAAMENVKNLLQVTPPTTDPAQTVQKGNEAPIVTTAAPAAPATPAPVKPPASTPVTTDDGLPNIGSMSMEEFASKRAELEGRLKNLV